MDAERDYKRFDELMNFWKTMPLEIHVSWHEAFEKASTLPEGKRSLSALRRLFAKARNRESIDLCDLEWKLNPGLSSWYGVIGQEDLERKIPLIFGRLLGMKEPDNSTDNVWQSYFMPLATTRQMVSVCALVNDILQLMHVGRHFLGYEAVQVSVEELYGKFKTCLRMNRFRAWRQKLRLDFPELLGKHPTREMRATLGEEFCGWVEVQDDWLWSEEV
ncbi:hypothetical protein CI102_4418 [Trichoderma harzianum]|uniref:Uncharacterized protein n=1 Tax=Trichoderma harzianum CBS 226.95 TaxID=983964 RepID=A0A2T4AAY1_TRIHA|nr:hypothetical protein M431DRAFT_118122 [Trichoderma harzianum CBS 226.95]PKK53114.1 hypothetical protein CI102_4418 [Trichoderma harzianum]PTB54235.1 hypothetical protein M431DRAFT_118122 [Trichoderma harzianum CBS 226.95]